MNKLIGPAAAIFLVALAPLANAEILITYTVAPTVAPYLAEGGTCSLANSDGPVTCPNQVGNGPNQTVVPVTDTIPLTINNLSASSNSPGTSSLSFEVSTALDIINTSSSTETITVNIEAQGFTAPTAPPDLVTLLSNAGGTVFVGSGVNALSFESCLDETNSLAGCSGSTLNAILDTPTITAPGSFSQSSTTPIASLAAPYALDEAFTVTLGAGGSINLSNSTTLTAIPVPEPMSITLLGGAVLLCSGMLRRKRKQASQV
jgi:hypothetical protein